MTGKVHMKRGIESASGSSPPLAAPASLTRHLGGLSTIAIPPDIGAADNAWLPRIAAIVALGLLCVAADALLKRAALSDRMFANPEFALGTLLYALSAFGWVAILRTAKLATIGALYSVVIIVGLALVGVLVFRESLSLREYVGLGCAIAALVLLGRDA